MKITLVAVALLGCETRGISSSLLMEKECYSGLPGRDIVVYAQVKDASAEGANDVRVRWQSAPLDGLVAITSQTTTSAKGDLGGLRIDGLASTTVHIGDMSRIGSTYTIIAQTIDDNAFGGSSRLVVSDPADAGCVSIDAGVEDASPPDVAPSPLSN